jgi:hypothetical protein
MWAHRVNGLLIFGITIIFLLRMYAYFEWTLPRTKPHYTLGAWIFALVIIVVGLGEFARDYLRR